MIENIILVGVFWAMYFTILTAIWWLKEVKAYQPRPFSILDQPPFDCRYCLTTWSMLASYISIAVIISNFWFGFCGVILSIGEALALKYKMKQMIVDEDK